MKKFAFILTGIGCSAFCAPHLLITPNITPPSQLKRTDQTAAVYQVLNNTRNRTFHTLTMDFMPAGVTPNTDSVSTNTQYCTNPFELAPGEHCLLKATINSNVMSNALHQGPVVCLAPGLGVNCVQPSPSDQLNVTIGSALSQTCANNVANFNAELRQSLDSTDFVPKWGPPRNPLSLSASNPDLTNCPTSAGVTWSRTRVIAAADYWISQKLNYCHHYNPDWATPVADRTTVESDAGYCNPAGVNTDANQDPYYSTSDYPYINTGQQVRWNYSGKGHETQRNWVNNNQMWYGFDCSNYTAFLYNFALNIQFDSKTNYQAGQTTDGCDSEGKHCVEDDLSPNQQSQIDPAKILNNPGRAGYLVCSDGTTDPTPDTPTLCAGHGGYLSSINSSGLFTTPVTISNIVQNGAPILKPGDIMFIAGGGPDFHPNPDSTTSSVTHAILWIGKQVGYGPNDINPSLIAPSSAPCASYAKWGPSIGDWVISDSHYQGADYRVLSQCFYLNDLWGVRRVLN